MCKLDTSTEMQLEVTLAEKKCGHRSFSLKSIAALLSHKICCSLSMGNVMSRGR